MANSFVYKWTDKLTGKLYIGSHKGTIDDGYDFSSKPLREEYNKRPNDFTREILAEFNSYEDAYNYETKCLVEADAKHNPIYYNQHNNDKGKFYIKQHTEETKRKIGIANKGKIRTIKQKQNISNKNKGKNSWIKGKNQTKEHRMRIADSMRGNQNSKGRIPWNKGKTISEEHKKKISNTRKQSNAI